MSKSEVPNWKGYHADCGCDVCGDKPAWIEPRFGYTSCIKHSYLTPVQFKEAVDESVHHKVQSGKGNYRG